MNLIGVSEEALAQYKTAQLRNLYRRDYTAWKADVLGYHTYQKMQLITEEALFGAINRTAIKSSNGTSKSFEVAAMISWVASVHEPGEAVAIVTAPSIPQMEKVTWAYLKTNMSRAEERGYRLPGWLNESLGWKVTGPHGNIDLAYGRKPAAGSEVSVFQGTRSQFGKTYVFIEEAGGVSKALFTAAEAVLTGADARGIYIGNPDDTGTEWEKIHKDKKYDNEFNRFTISSFDLPTFTGEIVYPDDPEMQKRMMASLTQKSWVEHKKRIWGEHDARYLSKVLGEFPKDGGNGFFSQTAITRSHDTDIPEDLNAPLVVGADIARWGQDESVIAANRRGRIRVEDSWGQCDLVDSARRIHKFAQDNQAVEVRIDAAGVGGGVHDMLDRLDEFAGKVYKLVGWDNGYASPDISQWANMRAYSHDSLRSQMMAGEIDLDFEDDELKDQLEIVTYKFTNRGGIQITAKEDMKSEMGGSPDRLDAVIMAGADMSPWTGNPLNELAPGDRVLVDSDQLRDADMEVNPWYGTALQPF